MSLDAMLASHDETALVALANKGLVRRAKRDLEAGLAHITSRETDVATVEVDGHSVTITDAGPRARDCTCPATGICRHLLTAILALQSNSATPSEQISALDELLKLSDAEITKFAGADLQAALALSTTQTSIEQDGASVIVQLPDMPAPVQFIAGRPPKEAVFKGPASRKRLATAAALLAIRQKHGASFDIPQASMPPETNAVTTEFLDEIASALERLFVATLRGGASVCMDHVFDLAISARAQSAPRLTGELRALVTEARLSIERHVAFEPERFVTSAARSYALVHALRKTPDDPRLLGVLQREYIEAPPITAMTLGAMAWHSPSGARGMRAFLYDMGNSRWISTGQARAGGADPAFTPTKAYELSTLKTSSANELMGHYLHIQSPSLSDDLQLSPSSAAEKQNPIYFSELFDSPALFRNWSDAQTDLSDRMQRGLRQRNTSLPILLEPAAVKREGFDEFEQTYRLRIFDKSKDAFSLLIPSKNKEVAKWLEEAGSKLCALLCVTTNNPDDFALSPVAAITVSGKKVDICNFAFDPLPRAKSLLKTISRSYAGQMESFTPVQPLLQSQCQSVIRQLIDCVSGQESAPASMLKAVEAQGLGTLYQAIQSYNATPTPKTALQAIYLANRVGAYQ